MHRKLARALLTNVYHEVSAVVSLGEKQEILDVFLFDTMFYRGKLRIAEKARAVYLISNHPEGRKEPYEQDLRRYTALCLTAREIPVKLFISSEYFTCCEAEVPFFRKDVI